MSGKKDHSIHQIDLAPCEPWMIYYLKSITDKTKTESKEKGDPKTTQDPPGTRKIEAGDVYTDLLKNGCTRRNEK